MKKRTVLRLISLAMLAIAVVFAICCMSCPTLGQAIRIGPFRFGAEQWRVCYAVYAAAAGGLFAASFLVKK